MEQKKKTTLQNPAEKQQFLTKSITDDFLKPFKTIRLAVSGDVHLTKLETDIIDTAQFQRLRGIKELGTTYLVYPTALHTRFDHSIGTLSMATEMIQAIKNNKHSNQEERHIDVEQEILIRLLALLHDISHVPFGHTIEDEFCIFERHDKDNDRLDYFLGDDSRIGRLIRNSLGKDMFDRFIRIFRVDKENLESLDQDYFIYDLVNNTVCADLLDYLRRDCYFTNISLDMDYRFLRYLYLREDGKTKQLLIRLWKEGKPTPRRDILSDLIRLLDNRYLLGERVYFHHAKLISGAMMAAAVQRSVKEGKLKQSDLYTLTDETLIEKLNTYNIPCVTKLVTSLRERKLWKAIYEKDRTTLLSEQPHSRHQEILGKVMREWWKDAPNRQEKEDKISILVGMDIGDFLVHCPDEKMAMKLAGMKVFWNGEIRPLEKCEDDPIIGEKLKLIVKSHKNLWAIRGFVNPDYLDKKYKIVEACNYYFSYKEEEKAIFQRHFYENVVDQIAKQEGLNIGILQTDYELKKQNATERLTAESAKTRDIVAIKEIVKNAFSS